MIWLEIGIYIKYKFVRILMAIEFRAEIIHFLKKIESSEKDFKPLYKE